jgi:hypothetical protein
MVILRLLVTQVSAVVGFFFISAPDGFLDTLWFCAVPLRGSRFCLPCCPDLVLGDRLTGGLASKSPSLDLAGFLFTCDAVP